MSSRQLWLALAVAGLVICWSGVFAHGRNSTWRPTTGGLSDTPANWSPGNRDASTGFSRFDSSSGGLLSGCNRVIRGGSGGIINGGVIAFSDGVTDVYGDLTQNIGGRITITGGGVVTFHDDVTIAAGANNIQVRAVGSVVSTAVFLGSYNGGVTGGGAAFIEGDHRPGNSPALVTFGGDVFYGNASKLIIEIGGTNRGAQYDAIDSSGKVHLSGALEVSLLGGFTPSTGDTFNIITAASGVAGQFSTLASQLPVIVGAKHWGITYNPNSVLLTVLAGAFDADFDEDGDVDAADLVNWKAGFGVGASATHTQGDANGDGRVDGVDFAVWQQQLGGDASLAIATSGGAVIPEPSGVSLLLAAFFVASACRRVQSTSFHRGR